LNLDEEKLLADVIYRNKNLFAWTAAYMSSIHPDVMSHKLTIFKEARPVARKKMKMGEERRQMMEGEVKKLLEVGFIWEIKYTT